MPSLSLLMTPSSYLITGFAPTPRIQNTKSICSFYISSARSSFFANPITRRRSIINIRSRHRGFVVRAGIPSTNSLILAFLLPFSLLVGTIFTAIRIADRLDEKYLEEVAMNEAIMEEEQDDDEEAVYEDEDEDEDEKQLNESEKELVKNEEQVVVVADSLRARNRPRRQV